MLQEQQVVVLIRALAKSGFSRLCRLLLDPGPCGTGSCKHGAAWSCCPEGAPVTSSAIGSRWSLQGNALVLQLFPEAITTLFLNAYSQEFNIFQIFTALSEMETDTHCNSVSLDSLRKQASCSNHCVIFY